MFTARAFDSWLGVVAGGALFGLLFGLTALMTEFVLEGTPRVSRWVVVFGLTAFAGYVGVAALLRMERAPDAPPEP